MPQLDVHSYFSAATAVILSFSVLLFIMHTYMLPKLAQCLNFRKKRRCARINSDQNKAIRINSDQNKDIRTSMNDLKNYIIEMESILNHRIQKHEK